MSSVSTRQPTSIEVRATKLTIAWSTTISPTCTGVRKSSRSIDAVSTAPAAWRIAATPAHTSIHCIITPPNITPAAPLVCVGMTIWVITQREASGVSEATTGLASLLLAGRRGRLLGRLGGVDRALDAGLELVLRFTPLHLPRAAVVSVTHAAAPSKGAAP